ncbi:hypothetical protein GJ496_001346 [Pomphorhynchus laevis]|nr:hypothetical protein GJ496_001346 [Pomphorhynchus laevis]
MLIRSADAVESGYSKGERILIAGCPYPIVWHSWITRHYASLTVCDLMLVFASHISPGVEHRDYVQPNPKGETCLDLGTKHQDRINNIDLSTLNARIQNTQNYTSIRINDKVTETVAGLRQQFMNEHSMDKSMTEVSAESVSLEQIYCEVIHWIPNLMTLPQCNASKEFNKLISDFIWKFNTDKKGVNDHLKEMTILCHLIL